MNTAQEILIKKAGNMYPSHYMPTGDGYARQEAMRKALQHPEKELEIRNDYFTNRQKAIQSELEAGRVYHPKGFQKQDAKGRPFLTPGGNPNDPVSGWHAPGKGRVESRFDYSFDKAGKPIVTENPKPK